MSNSDNSKQKQDILSGVAIKLAKPPFHVFMLETVPSFFHDLGRSICEIILDLINGILFFTGRFIGFLWVKSEKFRSFMLIKLGYLGIIVLSPFLKLSNNFNRMRKDVKAANREYGLRGAIPAFFGHFLAFVFGRRGGGAVTTAFNYIIPVVSVMFLVNIISYASNTEYAVKLEVNGVFVGYIENERVFTDAEKIYEERLNFHGSINSIDITPQFTIEKLGDSEILSVSDVTNILIERSGISVEWAYGVIINNNFMGAVSDNSRILETLDELLEAHSDGSPDEKVAFLWEIDVEQGGRFPSESIIDPQSIIRSISRKNEEAQFYTVVEGDSHYLIADKLGVSMQELERLNPGFIEWFLMPGDRVQYSAEVPFLPVSVTRTEVYDQAVPFTTEIRDDDSLFVGSQTTSVEGQYGYDRITASVTLVNGVETERIINSRASVSQPVTQIVLRGTRPLPGGQVSQQTAGYNKFIWPVPMQHKISEWGWWDGGYGRHSGIDIGAPYGTPIFAGASGTVVHVGWHSGYGHTVILEHPNGLRTLYGHASAYNVVYGQTVSQGETIAFVGATGIAYGNHVHFEVIENNVRLNPRHYLEFWY